MARKLSTGPTVFLVAALGLSACSSAEPSPDSGTSEARSDAPSWLAAIDEAVEVQYDGKFLDVVDDGPSAVPDVSAWYISCGQAIAGCAQAGAGFQDAGEALGWDVTYVDGKFDPNEVSNGIKQAVSAGADAIGINVFDCAAVKTALEQAKAAGIPVVSTWSSDCAPSLLTAITTFAGTDPTTGLRDYTADKVRWAISQTRGKAKFIDIYQTDLGATVAQEDGYQVAMSECPDCETVETVKVTTNTFANLQALVTAALTKHPEANALNIPYGGLLPSGVQAAIQQTGRSKDIYTVGGACDGGELDLMKQGWTISCHGYEQAQTGWMTADYLNRILAGEDVADFPAKGIGYQLVDSDHPQSSDTFVLPVDYKAAYEKVWTGQ